ncbi:MAG: glycosyltransferase [Spirochaetaceae bacterium]|nr:glycosyltransferase [Spirochaetaceae bacterium]
MPVAVVLYNLFRFGFALVFAGLHCALMVGLFREWRWDRRMAGAGRVLPDRAGGGPGPADSPRVSVIIPLRNEARRMAGLLESLGGQDYPQAEFIFIDDRSSDGTGGLLREFAKKRKGVIIITLKENPGPNHKQYALNRGIEAASGNLFLFTDADCEVPPGWIRAMTRRMGDPRTGATIGPVFKKYGGRGFFHLYQCFDHAVRYMYLAGSTGIGAAGGGFGNNLILSRDALQAIGGYGTIPPSPTEDAALISRIRSHSDYAVHSACGSDVPVMTQGESSWKDLVNQTLRWNNGGLFSPDRSTRLNFGFLMITISMGMLAIPLVPLIPSLWPLPGAVFFSMTLNTIATLALFGSSLPKKGAAYGLQLVFTPMYFTFLTVLSFFGVKIDWKGSRVSS